MPYMDLGPWLPDIAPHVNAKGLNDLINAIPAPDGYRGFRELTNIPNATALDARSRGSISGFDSGGLPFTFAGDENKLYQLRDGGMIDVSRPAGYTMAAEHRWSFAKFANYIFAVTPNSDMQVYLLGSGGTFEDVEGAPRAATVMAFGAFVMAGNIYDPFAGSLPHAVSWSGAGQPLYWPAVGSDEATAAQADAQPLEGEGGWVQDVVSGVEVGVVFQEKALWRMDYIGGTAVFDINIVEKVPGMWIPESGVAFGRNIFYIAEDGFRVTDYTQSNPIGKGRVNRYFKNDLDADHLDRVWVAKDPDETRIAIGYPGQGSVDGQPNRIIFWDYELDAFGRIDYDHDALIQNVTSPVNSLDAPATPGDPDTLGDLLPDPPGDPENVGETSFDDRIASAGASALGAFDTSFIASDFTGTQLAARFETGDMELSPGGFSRIDQIRPRAIGREAEASVGRNKKPGGDVVFNPPTKQNSTGWCPQRKNNGSSHRVRLHLPAGWEQASGFDLRARPAGRQ